MIEDISILKGKLKHPPKTRRFCLCCEIETTFKYDRNIGHSCCVECGGRFSKLMPRKCKICHNPLERNSKRTLWCAFCKKEFGVW
jgi:hypothetical protein